MCESEGGGGGGGRERERERDELAGHQPPRLQSHSCGVLQRLKDLRLPQEHVATASPPQHTLKDGHPLSSNDSRDEGEPGV